MIKSIMKIFIILILVLIPVLGLADTIYLIDGSVIKGEIIEITDDTVTIETKMGTLIVDKENIQKIEFDDLPEEEEVDPDEQLREEIRESLKDMVDEENIVIIIIKEEDTKEEDTKEEVVDNEEDIKEDEVNNDNDIPEDEINNEEVTNDEEQDNNQNVEFHNESNNNNENNEDRDITDWEYDYDNEDDYDWADDNDNDNNNDDYPDEDSNKGRTSFSLGFSSIGILDEFSELFQFGVSFRFLIDGWLGINGDINYGSTFTEWTSYSLGLALLVPSWKFTPLVMSALSYDQYYSYYYDDSYEGVTGSIGGGFEWFMVDWLSIQWYVKKYFSLNTQYGSARAIEDDFYTGIILYLNF